MITYGKYIGNLMIILRQNRKGFCVLDVYNRALQRFRFVTDTNEESLCKAIIDSSIPDIPESLIDMLLTRVVSGTHKKWYWIFAKEIQKDLLNSCVRLVSEKYKR